MLLCDQKLQRQFSTPIRACKSTLTIVAFGTSAPELVVSGVAAYRGNPGLALRAWQRCVQALDAELGIAPLPATRALVEPLLSAGARLETSP